MWAQQTPLGDSVAIIYIEDNHFQNTDNNVNNADSNYAGRYVYRFNNTTSGRQACEVHSVQGLNRASQRFEIYGNSGSNPSGFSGIAFIRGGSGVAFGNRLAANWPSFGIEMDNVRSEGDPGEGVGACDGSSGWDQNASGQNGYRCRDQIGASRDLTQWSHVPPQPYDQEPSSPCTSGTTGSRVVASWTSNLKMKVGSRVPSAHPVRIEIFTRPVPPSTVARESAKGPLRTDPPAALLAWRTGRPTKVSGTAAIRARMVVCTSARHRIHGRCTIPPIRIRIPGQRGVGVGWFASENLAPSNLRVN